MGIRKKPNRIFFFSCPNSGSITDFITGEVAITSNSLNEDASENNFVILSQVNFFLIILIILLSLILLIRSLSLRKNNVSDITTN